MTWEQGDGFYRDDLGFLERWTTADGTTTWRRVDLGPGRDPKATAIDQRIAQRQALGQAIYTL